MSIENLAATAQQLGLYMVTVILGLLVHALVTLPGIYYMFTRKNPAVFFQGMLQAWVTALGTASRYVYFRDSMWHASMVSDLRNEYRIIYTAKCFTMYILHTILVPLWSSGQSSWLQIQRYGLDFRPNQIL
jgi:hypothetical protein